MICRSLSCVQNSWHTLNVETKCSELQALHNPPISPTSLPAIPLQSKTTRSKNVCTRTAIAAVDVVEEVDTAENIVAMTEEAAMHKANKLVAAEVAAEIAVATAVDSRMAEERKMPSVVIVEGRIIMKKTAGSKMAERMTEIETIVIVIHGDTIAIANIRPMLLSIPQFVKRRILIPGYTIPDQMHTSNLSRIASRITNPSKCKKRYTASADVRAKPSESDRSQ